MHRGRVVEQGPTGRGPRPPAGAVHAARCARACRGPDGSRRAPCAYRPKERPRDLLPHPRPRQRPRPHAGPRRARGDRDRRRRRPDRRGRRRRRGPRGRLRGDGGRSTSAARPSCPGSSTATCTRSWARSTPAGPTSWTPARSRTSARGSPSERARCEPHQWVLGYGLDYNVFADTGISGDLIADAAGGGPGDHDVHRTSTRRWRRRGRWSSRASTGRGRSPSTPRSSGRGGVPTGELREQGAMNLVRAVMPAVTDEERYRYCVDQLKRFAAVGMTGAHGMDGTLETLDLLRSLEGNGDLAIRLVMPSGRSPRRPRRPGRPTPSTATRRASAGAPASRSSSSTA